MTAFTIYPPTPQGFEDMTEDLKKPTTGALTEKEKDEQGEQDILDEAKGREKNEPYYNK